ncbi:MAG: hypothetical protein ISN29_02355, partial [Gammaproteobacteria bacterium AqS3]|nr:hypothetical protein [Gammaproteobacteria bacterium AqS3]
WAAEPAHGDEEAVLEHRVRTALRRHGVLFRAIAQSERLPWRDALGLLRRLEMREDVRGGRFVEGFGGEQFALPEAVAVLGRSSVRDAVLDIELPAADPLMRLMHLKVDVELAA